MKWKDRENAQTGTLLFQVFDKIFFRIINGWMACNCIKEIAKERSAKFSINKETAHSIQIRKQ